MHLLEHLPLGVGLMATLPVPPTGGGSPLGRFGPLVASIVAVSVVLAALAVHLGAVLGYGTGSDPFIDSAALLVIGVVLGATALGGTVAQVQQAHDAAMAANKRLDAIGAEPARDGGTPNA